MATLIMTRMTNFNPRSSCEERHELAYQMLKAMKDFNPRSSCEERRPRCTTIEIARKNFNPRSSCEERLGDENGVLTNFEISIHAPHARSDHAGRACGKDWAISIHAPHARSDGLTNDLLAAEVVFQSTLLMRGAT